MIGPKALKLETGKINLPPRRVVTSLSSRWILEKTVSNSEIGAIMAIG